MKKKVIFCFAIFSIFYAKLSIADDYFEPSLLGGYSNDDETPDLSTFYKKNGQVAGTYFTYVYFNNNIVKQGSIRFDYNNDSKSQLVPRTSFEYCRRYELPKSLLLFCFDFAKVTSVEIEPKSPKLLPKPNKTDL